MGLFSTIREMKNATKLENVVKEAVSQMDDPDGINEANLKLQIYVLEKDIERYRSSNFSSKHLYPQIDFGIVASGLEGIKSIYQEVLSSGVDSLETDRLEAEYSKASRDHDAARNANKSCYYAGRMKAIAGLLDSVLYNSWTEPAMPICPNPLFVKAIEKRNLLNVN